MQRVDVLTVGTVARQRLGEARQARLLGITRRGWLLHLDSDWVVFLTQEAARGPLTLNLADGAALPPAAPGLTAQVQGDALIFPAAGLRLDYRQACTWAAPPIPAQMLPAAERHARLVEVARLCLDRKRPKAPRGESRMGVTTEVVTTRLAETLAPLLGLEMDVELDAAPLEMVERLKSALRGNAREDAIVQALTPLLGLGRGLTPSGDDLALGLLLALRRWGAPLGWRGDVQTLCDAVAGLAAQRTTMLAANLIACAGLGQADERLLLALDGMVSGQSAAAECAAALGDWGSSSGVDALVGMALIL